MTTTPPAPQPDIFIGQVWVPNSGPAIDIAIVDFEGPGYYIVRNANGSGGTRSMRGDQITSRYTYDPDRYAY